MITAVLAAGIVFLLFYGRVSLYALILISLGAGGVLAVLSKQRHAGYLVVDSFAQTSRLKRVNPLLKFWTVLILIILCVSAGGSEVGLLVALAMSLLTTLGGQVKLKAYIHMLSLPLSFLLVGGLVLLFDAAPESAGVLSIPVFGIWLNVTAAAQDLAGLVMARALGAICCLYFLSMTTPMSDLIGVLRRMHCPAVVIDLMYLIYRYIFILLSMHHAMYDSAKSRMGYYGLRSSLRTTGNLYSNLLARSYRQANQMFDAMESRCYEDDIRFLEHKIPATAPQVACAAVLVTGTCLLWIL